MSDPTNATAAESSGVWPPKSERDARLAAYRTERRYIEPTHELTADLALSGLTPAQEIRLGLVAAWLTGDAAADDDALWALAKFAAWVEHGPDDLEDACTERCPNAEAHEEWPIAQAEAKTAAARAEVADLERQRDAVLAYLADEEEPLSELYDGRPVQTIRAIYAEHGNEVGGDG